MDNNLLNFSLNEKVQIGLIPFLESIFLATILCFLIQIVYVKFSNSLSNKFEFSKNFIILGLATTLIITIVKSSLALSLGLVGALSIVRFRAAIKEPEELVYLFLIIATGLGCGAGQAMITAIGIFVSLVILILFSIYWNKNKKFNQNLLNASIVFNKRVSDQELNKLTDMISKYCNEIKFISLSSTNNESTICFDLVPKNFSSISKINSNLKNLDKNIKIILTKDNILTL
jgi:hypothetical protein